MTGNLFCYISTSFFIPNHVLYCIVDLFDQAHSNTSLFSRVSEIRSSEKSQKIRSTDYENFDQLIKHNFDQVNFGQMTPCQLI